MDNGIKAKNGKKTESNVAKSLANITAVTSIEIDERNPNITFIDAIDFKVTLANGKVIWILATSDFFNGSLQVGRLELVYQNIKSGKWKKGEVFYVLETPGIPPSKKKTPAARQLAHHLAYNACDGFVGSISDMEDTINGLMSENEPTRTRCSLYTRLFGKRNS